MTGSEIRQLRSDLGWSQAQLAQHLGYTPNAINLWEHDRRTPPDLTKGVLMQMRKRLDEQKKEQTKKEFVQGLKAAAFTGGVIALMAYLFSED